MTRDSEAPTRIDVGRDHAFVRDLLGLPDDSQLLTGPAGLFSSLTDAQKIGLLVMRQGERQGNTINHILQNGCSRREGDLAVLYKVKNRVDRMYWMIAGASALVTAIVVILEIVRGIKHG